MTAADPDALKALLSVQEHDRELDALRHKRQTLPERDRLEEIAAARAALEADALAVRDQRHEIERHQKRLEDEVAMIEDRIKAEDAKLYGGEITGVKELQALQDEIRGLKDRQRGIEDDILEVMETAEPVDAELDAYAAKQADLDAQAAATTEQLSVSEAEVDAQQAEVQQARDEAAAAVGAELLDEYERLRSQPGAVGVARLVGSTCHGCHLELAAVEVDRLKKLPSDALVHCDECGCILVR